MMQFDFENDKQLEVKINRERKCEKAMEALEKIIRKKERKKIIQGACSLHEGHVLC